MQMSRKNFVEVLQSAKIDLDKEYDRLYALFYGNDDKYAPPTMELRDYCEQSFLKYPFRGTCLSLNDFDESYGFIFERNPMNVSLEYLLTFCEYTYNLVHHMEDIEFGMMMYDSPKYFFIRQVQTVIEKIGYMEISEKGLTIFVPKVPEAIAVSEIVEGELSYKVIEYNHHLMRGDVNKKKSIILLLSKILEAQRDTLNGIDKELATNIFFMFNNLDLRHNNRDKESKHYKECIAMLDDEELEQLYDDTYQMCLLAFLEIDNQERTKKVDELKSVLKQG